MSDLAITVREKQFKDGCLLGFDFSFHSALWGRLNFEDRNGVKLGLDFDEDMEKGYGHGPLYFRISDATERRRDWNLIPYGAPGIVKETFMTEVFVRLPLPRISKNGGRKSLYLESWTERKIPVLVLEEEEAWQIAEALRNCYNPGIAVAHADRFSTVTREEDVRADQAWLEKYAKEHKHDLSYNTLIHLNFHVPVRYQALIFDEFPDQEGVQTPPLDEPIAFEYEAWGWECDEDTEDEATEDTEDESTEEG